MRRRYFAVLLATTAVLSACFGDNSDSQGEGGDNPSVLEISVPSELDLGDRADVTVRVKGAPDVQLSVAVSATLGAFEPPSMVVLTDPDGSASFSTRYTSGNTPGDETISANASTLGGRGNSSTKGIRIYDVERQGHQTPLETNPTAETAQRLIAYPMVLATDRVVRKLGIVHPAQVPAGPVNVQIGLYSTDTATSLNVITKTTAVLNEGVNEISIPSTPLSAGSYWMVVAYSGTPRIYRSTTDIVVARYKNAHDYSMGLGDKIEGLLTSSDTPGLGTSFYQRNFYLVLRR